MKEDILEQLVEDFLRGQGYFTPHNVKFRPNQDDHEYDQKVDSVYSDIDILAYNPILKSPNGVVVVTCKSWQTGLRVGSTINAIAMNMNLAGRPAWKGFRELVKPKQGTTFCRKVYELTGSHNFTYYTAVTKCVGNRDEWQLNAKFKKNLQENQIKIITVAEMMDEMMSKIDTTVASSQVGRLLQIVKASGWRKTG